MRFGRMVVVVGGVVLVLVGLAVLALSVPGLAVVGFDDTLATGVQPLVSETAVIATAEAGLGDSTLPDRKRTTEEQWDLRLQATTAGGEDGEDGELFLGIGPADEVEPWLDEVAWDNVTVFGYRRFSVDGTDVRYERAGAPGDPSDAPAPFDEDFWTVSDVGTSVALDWDYREGHYVIVLMNADGTAGIDAEGSFTLEIPRLSLFFGALTAAGLGLLLLGLAALLVPALLARRHRQTPASATSTARAPAAPGTDHDAGADAEPAEVGTASPAEKP